MRVGERVRVKLIYDPWGITWGYLPQADGAIGEIVGVEHREAGARYRVLLPAAIWPRHLKPLCYPAELLEVLA